ncbi:enolase-phosphatase E1-like isoform X2 [Stegodyphus dumicola]|uniref:enolase-phosphatase E1-like isoform X2 n=1 Tax=Stegodyphus dumicola TaxID=202533 RepID=UPI0015AE7172|nr:enolase-phosphatase E1-like isoform X2 [Stegodyphus dumicola]
MNNLKDLVQKSDCILLDVEGTTTSFDFVKNKEDQKAKLCGYVPLPSVKDENFQEAVICNLLWQMSSDRKTTGLKKIQGFIWREEYEKGFLKGHVYEDAVQALNYWKSNQKKIYIYSSGSIEAQRLLFNHSIWGNLEYLIDGNFDTTIGSKTEHSSYSKICEILYYEPQNVLFITDRPKEIFAAKKSGMNAILIKRDPNHSLLEEEKDYIGYEDASITTFADLMEDN